MHFIAISSSIFSLRVTHSLRPTLQTESDSTKYSDASTGSSASAPLRLDLTNALGTLDQCNITAQTAVRLEEGDTIAVTWPTAPKYPPTVQLVSMTVQIEHVRIEASLCGQPLVGSPLLLGLRPA